ncbi:transcriptional regulator, partial [Salinisphaera shabanensis T35B1]
DQHTRHRREQPGGFTHLAASVERGSFRADLFNRLNVPITVPPLRERRAEIPHLVETIMRRLADRHGEPPLLHDWHWGYLMRHDWPGNIRELENHLERLWFVVPEDQPTESTAQAGRSPTSENREAPLANALAATEYRCLEQALRQCSTTYEIARYLGISQPSVVRKLRHHGLRATGRGSGKTAARRERRKAIKKAPVV